MRPVIQRIAQSVRDGLRPCEKPVKGIGIAGAVALCHSIGSHGSPLVVIAFEPDLVEIAELPVIRNVLRGKMAVVIKDRLHGRILVIEEAGELALQYKIFSDESHVTYLSKPQKSSQLPARSRFAVWAPSVWAP